MPEVRSAIGLMSGTSLDGVDVALIETDGERIVTLGPAKTYPYVEADREILRQATRDAAGLTDRGGITDTSVELWDRLFAVNARAPFILIQTVARRLKALGRPGAIVNVITMSSHGGQPFLTAYAASKGALATLTKNTAHALRADGQAQGEGRDPDDPGDRRRAHASRPPVAADLHLAQRPFR